MTEELEAQYRGVERKLQKLWEENEPGELHSIVEQAWAWHIGDSVKAGALHDQLSAERYCSRLEAVREFAGRLFNALHAGADSSVLEIKPKSFWKHQEFDLDRAADKRRGFDIDIEELGELAAAYLRDPQLQNYAFEWYLLDALVFSRLDAVAYHARDSGWGAGINWRWIFFGPGVRRYALYSVLFGTLGFLARYVAPPALVIVLMTIAAPGWAITVGSLWAIYLLLRLISAPGRWRVQNKFRELLRLLLDVYVPLGGSTISPPKLKEALDKAAAGGVVFDGAVFALVDRMIQKDSTVSDPNG